MDLLIIFMWQKGKLIFVVALFNNLRKTSKGDINNKNSLKHREVALKLYTYYK